MSAGNRTRRWSTGATTYTLAFLVGLVAFLTLPLLLAYLSSHISAKRLAEAEEPPWDFPVVAYSMHGSNSKQGRYLYLDWEQLASREGVRFRLPEPTGKVDKTGSKHGRRYTTPAVPSWPSATTRSWRRSRCWPARPGCSPSPLGRRRTPGW